MKFADKTLGAFKMARLNDAESSLPDIVTAEVKRPPRKLPEPPTGPTVISTNAATAVAFTSSTKHVAGVATEQRRWFERVTMVKKFKTTSAGRGEPCKTDATQFLKQVAV
jgi:hypothetical protein